MENVKLLQDYAMTLPSMYMEWWWNLYEESPIHLALETSLILFILWVVFFKKQYNPEVKGYGGRAPTPLSEKEKQELIDEWEPAPLVPPAAFDGAKVWNNRVTVTGVVDATHVSVEGRDEPLLNMASNDFLGLGASDGTEQVAKEAMEEYTLGSCGPRGFYGTTKKHIDLESTIAKFMGTSEAICYADSVSCVASAVPAFSKRGDLLIIDDAANHALRTGALLSRSKCLYYKHNDMEDLERVLRGAVQRFRSSAKTQRRFIVFEGLFKQDGSIPKLDKIAELAARFKFRLMCDESLSWGVLGAAGRGVTEHFNLPVSTIHVIIASLAATLGSIGGFCVGNREVTDHQRLAGAGYCFSASAPPFLCATAESALKRMTPELLSTLRQRTEQFTDGIRGLRSLNIVSHSASPVVHAQVAESLNLSPADIDAKLDAVVIKCRDQGVLIARSHDMPEDIGKHPHSLRVQLSAAMSAEDVQQAIAAVRAVVAEVFDEDVEAGAGAGASASARGARARKTQRKSTARATASATAQAPNTAMRTRRSARLRKKAVRD